MPNIIKNIKVIKSKLKNNEKYCFVAKANCYGFGSTLCKKIESEVDYFAVSSAGEFFKLKKLVKKPIIVLDPVYSNIKRLICLDAVLIISNLVELKKIIKAALTLKRKVSVLIALNTGMNRFGFKSNEDIKTAIDLIKKTQKISILGVFSHYFDGKSENLTFSQNLIFLKQIDFLRKQNVKLDLISISATDGVTRCKFSGLVRIGMGNYTDDFFDTLKLSSKIIEIQNLKTGEVAGYGGVFAPKKDSKIAVVGIGYGDGIFRNIVKKGYVLIKKTKCKIVAICMDAMLVDITGVDAKIEDEVILIGSDGKNKIFICDVASWCDTISYEIIVRLAERIERKYLE